MKIGIPLNLGQQNLTQGNFSHRCFHTIRYKLQSSYSRTYGVLHIRLGPNILVKLAMNFFQEIHTSREIQITAKIKRVPF